LQTLYVTGHVLLIRTWDLKQQIVGCGCDKSFLFLSWQIALIKRSKQRGLC